uniref:CRIB domain-containing protein n=1 Tax=Nothobranchius furzeri TaxID=105023 RepID=A0A8C6P5T2_NOTFU
MPILKQLVSSAPAKRRSRMDLTREMISAPLGDFRHTMHVGRSGLGFHTSCGASCGPSRTEGPATGTSPVGVLSLWRECEALSSDNIITDLSGSPLFF